MKPPKKAVIAAAGFGTRFLPQTKAMPKEMLPIVDKPVIQYIVEDLVKAGITDIIIVGSSNKRAIEDHFDIPNEDLLNNLRAGGEKKQPYIDEVYKVSNLANFIYLRQKGRYGPATPLLNASHLIGDEPFIYCYADDIMVAEPNLFQQMIASHEKFGGSILPCLKLENDKDYDKYGVLAGDMIQDDVLKMSGVVEKPGKEKAPSNFASVGGFLFTPDVIPYLEAGLKLVPDDDEFYLTDYVIAPMIAEGHDFYGCITQNSQRYDTGNKLEYLKANIDFGLKHPELGPELKAYLESLHNK